MHCGPTELFVSFQCGLVLGSDIVRIIRLQGKYEVNISDRICGLIGEHRVVDQSAVLSLVQGFSWRDWKERVLCNFVPRNIESGSLVHTSGYRLVLK